MHAFVRFFGVASALTLASSALADSNPVDPWEGEGPDPYSVHITNLTANGTGCPADSVAAVLTPDGRTLSLTYNQFVAQAGPGIALSEARKNCIINFVVHVPPGFSYAVVSADYRGYAQLGPGVVGMQRATYYISGQMQSLTADTTLVGPFDDDYFRRDAIEIANVVWSPCGRDSIANVNAQVRVNNAADRSQSGVITTDSTDFEVKQLYQFNFVWRRCT